MNNKKNEVRTKNILIGALLVIILIMGVGYFAFAQQLTISERENIISTWDVEITNILATATTGSGQDVSYVAESEEDGTRLIDGAAAQFKASLTSPGDSVTYTVTVENKGTINAQIDSITFVESDTSTPISYTHTANQGTTLNAGDTITFTVTITYDESVEEQPETTSNTLTMYVNYAQAS